MPTYSDTFSARPYDLQLVFNLHETDAPNNRSRYTGTVQVKSNSGWGSYRVDPFTVINTVNGTDYNVTRSSGLDFRPDSTGKIITVGSFTTGWINHNSDGTKSFSVRSRSDGTYGVYGSADTGNNTFTAQRITVLPSAPGTPSTSNVSSSRIDTAWTAPSSDGGGTILEYEVQRATNSGFTTGLSTVSTGTTRSRSWTGLTRATTYYFRARARNSAGWGPWSGTRTQATSPTVPSAPGTPTTSGVTSSKIDTAWAAPSDTGGQSILEYQVQRASNSAFTSGVSTVSTGTGRSNSFTGLAAGTTYYFRSRARNATGWGAWSGTRTQATAATVPGAPGTPTTSGVTSSKIDTAWSAPGSTGGSAITGYQVQRATNSSFTSGLVTLSTNASTRSASFTGLSHDTVYYFRARAQNAVGWGAWSGTRTQSTGATAPNTPAQPSIGSVTVDSMAVSWVAPADNGSAITGYDLQYAANSSFSGATTVSPTGTSANLFGLAPATEYWVRVRAKNAIGTSGWSTARSAVTAPAAPTSLTAGQSTIDSIPLTWSSGSNGSAVTGYEVQYATNSGFTGVTTLSHGTTPSRVVGSLTPGQVYYFRVRAMVGGVASAWSSSASRATLSALPPNLVVVATPSGTGATAYMSPPVGIGSVDSYEVQRRLVGGASSTFSTTNTSLPFTGLTPGTVYQWRASMIIGSYQSPWSTWQGVTQPNPNTSPGEYFDGSTDATASIWYRWTGTANSSTSQAYSYRPKGWSSFADGDDDSGGTGAVYRTEGGRSQAFSTEVAFFTGTSAPGFHVGTAVQSAEAFEVDGGNAYGGLIHVRIPQRGQRLAAMLIWLNGSTEIGRSLGEPQAVPPSQGDWTALRASDVAPGNATHAALHVIDVAGPGWAAWNAGETFLVDDAIAPFDAYYFDGNTADTSQYLYEWDGAPNESGSERVPTGAPPADPLLDPNCPPMPAPPRPPSIEDACVDPEATQWRRFWVEVQPSYVHTWADSIPTLQITANDSVRQMRIRYFQNPFDRLLEELDKDSYCSEQVVSYLPGGAILTLDGITKRAWVEMIGSAESLPADHLIRLSDGGPSTWPELGCGSGYYVTVDTPLDTPSDAITVEYSIRQRY